MQGEMRKEGSGRFFIDDSVITIDDSLSRDADPSYPYLYLSKTRILENRNFGMFSFRKKLEFWSGFDNTYRFENQDDKESFFNGIYKDFTRSLVTLAEFGVWFKHETIDTQELRWENREILQFIIGFYGVDDPRCGAALISLLEIWKKQSMSFYPVKYNLNMFKLFTTINKKLPEHPSYDQCLEFLVPVHYNSELEKIYHRLLINDLTSFYKTLHVVCNPEIKFSGFFNSEDSLCDQESITCDELEKSPSSYDEKLNTINAVVHSLKQIHDYSNTFSNDNNKERAKFLNGTFLIKGLSYENYERICSMKNSDFIEFARYEKYFKSGSDMVDFYLDESAQNDQKYPSSSEYLLNNRIILSEENKNLFEDLGLKINLEEISNLSFMGAIHFFLTKYSSIQKREKLGLIMDRIFTPGGMKEDYELCHKVNYLGVGLEQGLKIVFKLYIKYMNDDSTIPFLLWRELILDENE